MTRSGQVGNESSIRQDDIPEQEPRQFSIRVYRGLAIVFVILMIVFSAIPLVIDLQEMPNKDYSLWYQVGVVLRQGIDLYPDPSTGRLFPFMYPPSAAALLGFLSVLGKHGTTLVLILAHSVAWWGAIFLSVWLATGGKGKLARQHPLLYVAPSLCVIALIHNTYLLGQPNLSLLTLLLGAFACLRGKREVAAGALVATAAAIKAFPILAIGYFIYRRMWRATAATLATLAIWLFVVPLPFRTPAQAARDLSRWSRGMIFTYNAKGIAQRPFRSFSYKNQSIMAMTHRLLRDVPADGEKVLSEHLAQSRPAGNQPPRGMRADGSFDLAVMLTAPPETPSWKADFATVQPALQRAWRVNVVSLGFRTVTAVTLTAMLALALFVIAVWPPRRARTALTDSVEFAHVTLLIVMFSPLSFNYAFVWLIYPYTVALYLVMNHPAQGRWRSVERAWLAAAFLIPATAVFTPLYAQAYGNLFVPAVLLVIGLGVKPRTITPREGHGIPFQGVHTVQTSTRQIREPA
ncbi:MAG: glycosyltransferase family 87 protein [Isosphaeraceae bacterium]